MTAKDQSECQLISGTKQNKKRPGRWSWVVDLSKTDWQDTKKVLKAHWRSYTYLCVNNLECKFFMWHVLRSVSRPAVLYSHCAQFPRWIIEREQSDSLRDSVWNSDSLWLQITTRSVSQIRLIYIISHLNDLCQTDFRWLHWQEKFLKVNAWVWRDNLCGIFFNRIYHMNQMFSTYFHFWVKRIYKMENVENVISKN